MASISGNTYPVRAELKALGGVWNSAARSWTVPEEKASQARLLVNNAVPAHSTAEPLQTMVPFPSDHSYELREVLKSLGGRWIGGMWLVPDSHLLDAETEEYRLLQSKFSHNEEGFGEYDVPAEDWRSLKAQGIDWATFLKAAPEEQLLNHPLASVRASFLANRNGILSLYRGSHSA